MRILLTTTTDPRARPRALETIARVLSDDILDRRAGIRPVGRVAFALAERPVAAARDRSATFRREGTPTDCVIMGARHVVKGGKPTSCCRGSIVAAMPRGRDLFGTVAGAMEEPCSDSLLALSQAYSSVSRAKPLWETAIRFAPDLIRRVLAEACRATVLVNINFPIVRRRGEGVAVATQGKRDQELLRIEPRHDGRGNAYYWIAFLARRVGECSGRQRSRGACRQAHRGDAAAARPDRRAVLDPPRRAVRVESV